MIQVCKLHPTFVIVYGFKMNCAFVFASHKGPTCILKIFVRISFGLHFKTKVNFHLVNYKANK